MMDKKDYFRRLPKVDLLLKEEKIQELCERCGRGFVVEAIREELDRVRALISMGTAAEIENNLVHFTEGLEERLKDMAGYSLKKVLNATGILLHTNLGLHYDRPVQASREPAGGRQDPGLRRAFPCGA